MTLAPFSGLHGAIQAGVEVYRGAGIAMLDTLPLSAAGLSGLLRVLAGRDSGHLRLAPAQCEVFSAALQLDRPAVTLHDCQRRLRLHRPTSLTPLSFPLWAESLRGQLSTEDWETRVQRAARQLEKKHGRCAGPADRRRADARAGRARPVLAGAPAAADRHRRAWFHMRSPCGQAT